MPTASTSQILGFNECFEPYTSNIYTRRVLAGEFQVVNKYLVKKLTELNLWNKQMKDRILVAGGSVMNIDEIPQHVRDVFKTVWDIHGPAAEFKHPYAKSYQIQVDQLPLLCVETRLENWLVLLANAICFQSYSVYCFGIEQCCNTSKT